MTLLDAIVPIAHAGAHDGAVDWVAWVNAITAVILMVLTLAYGLGAARLLRASRRGVRWWEITSFMAGVASVAVALLSRLDPLSDRLFSAHMAQHQILMIIGAPLMVIGRPWVVVLAAMPRGLRERIGTFWNRRLDHWWRIVSRPLPVLLVHTMVIWIWHVPLLYEGAIRFEPLHAFQHLCFFLAAALFWWSVTHGRFGRVGYGMAVVYTFFTAMHTSILGVLLMIHERLWYPIYEGRTGSMSPVDDQHLAGILMWIPSGVVLVVIALTLFAAWLGEAERRVAYTSAAALHRNEDVG